MFLLMQICIHQWILMNFLGYCLRFYSTVNGADRITELSELFELDRKKKISDLSMGNGKRFPSFKASFTAAASYRRMRRPWVSIPLMQARFFELLRSENRRGMTIFFSSHTLSEVQMLCKRVAIIKEGRIIKVEDIETLRKRQLKKIHIEFASEADNEIQDWRVLKILQSFPGKPCSLCTRRHQCAHPETHRQEHNRHDSRGTIPGGNIHALLQLSPEL